MDKFWLVWNPERGMPNFRHETEASAGTEAERLARKHKGEPIYILQCIAKAVVEKPAPPPPDPVVWEYFVKGGTVTTATLGAADSWPFGKEE